MDRLGPSTPRRALHGFETERQRRTDAISRRQRVRVRPVNEAARDSRLSASEGPTPSLDVSGFGPPARNAGGERGIRTLGRGVTPTHAFQACRLNHSRISPRREQQGYQPPKPRVTSRGPLQPTPKPRMDSRLSAREDPKASLRRPEAVCSGLKQSHVFVGFALENVAERVGFEPTVAFRLQRLSRPADSTTLAPLRDFGLVLGTGDHTVPGLPGHRSGQVQSATPRSVVRESRAPRDDARL